MYEVQNANDKLVVKAFKDALALPEQACYDYCGDWFTEAPNNWSFGLKCPLAGVLVLQSRPHMLKEGTRDVDKVELLHTNGVVVGWRKSSSVT